jgi:hypothetical protein
MYKLGVFLLLAISLSYGDSHRILCAYPTLSRSHFIVVDALMRGLAQKGHDVTVISAFAPEKPIPNYRHILNEMTTSHSESMKKFTDNPGEVGMSMDVVAGMMEAILNESHSMLMNPQVQKIMNEESFDLLVIEFMGEQHIGLAAHFNCPVIIFSSIKASYRLLEIMGNPLALSYVKHPVFRLDHIDSFMDRTLNFVFYIFEKLAASIFTAINRSFHDEHFPAPKYPTYDEMFSNYVSAVFVTDHFSQGDVRPLVPGVVEISGIQMTEEPEPLSDDLQLWMDRSPHGVVFVSLGSNMKVSNLKPEKLEAFVNVFRRINVNVLWKSDVTTIPGLPPNVRLVDWVSQIDVLQHKNLRLFITHGGFGSITEAKFYGVPILVIPMFADQIPNAHVVEQEGWGIRLPYAEFHEHNLFESIRELFENPTYLTKAKYESTLYRDRPVKPLQNGIYWVEYILRHNGAKHMRSHALDLNFFQLHSIDVIGFLLTIAFISSYISYRIMKCLFKKLCGSKKVKK